MKAYLLRIRRADGEWVKVAIISAMNVEHAWNKYSAEHADTVLKIESPSASSSYIKMINKKESRIYNTLGKMQRVTEKMLEVM